MSGEVRVSVLLPAYRAEATLPACLHSVARQTLSDFECLVVDDGSGDGTLACARRAAAADPRFRVLTGPHRGIVAALARGLDHCRAPLVARMDADDLMHRERLAAQVAALAAAPSLAGVGCRVRLFPRRDLSEGGRAYERWLNAIDSPRRVREEAFVECPIAHPTLLLRREVLAAAGYRDCGFPEDYDLLLRLLEAGHELAVLPRRLHLWRRGPRQLSRRHPRYALERFTACKAAYLARGLLAGSRGYVLWGYGETGKALRKALAARGRQPSHIVELHPRRLGQTIHGAPVIPPEALAGLRGVLVVVSVAGAGPRSEIRAALRAMGLRELRDFVCAA